MAIGFLLAGGDPEEQSTAALVISMRNPGLALLFTGRGALTLQGLNLAVLTSLLFAVVVQIPFVRCPRLPPARSRPRTTTT